MAVTRGFGRFTLGVCIVALLCLNSALGQSPDGQNQAKKYELHGKVINSATGNPIQRALVRINWDAQQRAVLTGPEGEFSFPGVAEGDVFVSVTKPGFFRRGDSNFRNSQGVAIQLGSETGSVTIKLTPEAVIYGQVIGKDEEPVEGATIQAVQASSRIRLEPSLARASQTTRVISMPGGFMTPARTDEDGNFRIAGLAPGTYYLMLTTGNFNRRAISRLRSDQLGYAPVLFYPGTADASAAVPIEISAGQRVHADFALKPVAGFKVAGTVRWSEEWKQVHPPEIVDPNGVPLFSADRFDPSSGAFEFDALPAGTYTLKVGGSDQNGSYRALHRKLTVDAPIAGLQILLRAPREIPVVVRRDFDKPLPPSTCTTNEGGKTQTSDCSDYPPVFIQLSSVDYGQGTVSSGFSPTHDPSAITISEVMPGKYSVRAMAQFGGYVQSLRCGSVDLLRDDLVVPEDGAVPPIEVTLRDDGASVKLRVRADGPSRGGWAVLVPAAVGRDPLVLDFKTNTDRDYGGIAPGDYRVFAFDSVDGIDYTDSEALAKFADKAAQVTLGANGSSVISLDLIRTGE